MQKNTLMAVRDLLFKIFVVGLLVGILLVVLTGNFWGQWSTFIYSKFQVTEKELGEMFVNSMLYIRLFLLFFILTPAIAIHWTLKSK